MLYLDKFDNLPQIIVGKVLR